MSVSLSEKGAKMDFICELVWAQEGAFGLRLGNNAKIVLRRKQALAHALQSKALWTGTVAVSFEVHLISLNKFLL